MTTQTAGSFIRDKEKMLDFNTVSREEMLFSYAYLSRKDYELTRKDVAAGTTIPSYILTHNLSVSLNGSEDTLTVSIEEDQSRNLIEPSASFSELGAKKKFKLLKKMYRQITSLLPREYDESTYIQFVIYKDSKGAGKLVKMLDKAGFKWDVEAERGVGVTEVNNEGKEITSYWFRDTIQNIRIVSQNMDNKRGEL